MPLVWKEIIPKPGTYWYRDQEVGTPRTITFTPEGIRHFHDTGKAMLAAGLAVPVPLEHQPWALPMSAADLAGYRARHNAGDTKDYRLTPQGGLEAALEVDDPEIARKLGKTLLWTSPYISSFTDGQGRDWHNVICHNAITTRPRITDQRPFPSVAAALSLVPAPATFDGEQDLGRGLAVCAAGLLVPRGNGESGLFPAYPVAFSLLSGARLSGTEFRQMGSVGEAYRPARDAPSRPKAKPYDPHGEGGLSRSRKEAAEKPAKGGGIHGAPMADDKGKADQVAEKPEKEGAAPEPGPEEETQPAIGPDGLPLPESKVDPDGDIPVWEVIRDLLEHEGLSLPEGTSHENFYENLYTCLMDKLKAGAQQPEVPMSDPTKPPQAGIPPTADPTKPPNVVQEQPPLFMSLEEINRVPDQALRASLSMGYSLREKAFNDAKKARLDKIDALLRRAPLHKREALRTLFLKQLSGAQLSLATDGTVKDEAAEWISAFSALIDEMPKDTPTLLQGSGVPTVQPHPEEYNGEMSEERRQQVVNELLRNIRTPAPAQKAG